jgi:DNA mismatch repair protein MutS2
VALKTIGLAALMAQVGIPVLAEEGSTLPPFSRLWCHLGDEQSLFSDLSTFTGAMRATASLLAESDTDTLVLYDELGSGTDRPRAPPWRRPARGCPVVLLGGSHRPSGTVAALR